MIVEKIRAYMDGAGKSINPQAMEYAVERLKRTLTNQFSSEHTARDATVLKLYPSEAGKCERQVLYKALGIPGEPFLSDVQFKLAMGDLVEMALMYIISVTPDLSVVENNKIRDITIGGRVWRGATDGILISGAERRNVEVKSASGIGFKMTIQRGVDDNFGYLTQASVYMRQLLLDKVINVPETIFVYIDRDSMKLWEVVVPYDEFLAKAADEKFLRIMEAVNKKKILPRPYQLDLGNKLPLNCRYCSHKYTCYVEPKQVVQFVESTPVYREPPKAHVVLRMAKNKPEWVLLES